MTTAGRRIVVIGELNLDLVASGLKQPPVPGKEILASDFRIVLGSASAIFSCGVAKLGNGVTFLSKVGNDAFGRDCRLALRAHGVSDKHVKTDPKHSTGVTIALSAAEDRALVTHLGAISGLKISDVPRDIFDSSAHLHMTSFFLQRGLRPSFASLFRRARRKGLSTSFDPNTDPSQVWKSDVWDVISETDILFVNESEALSLSRKRTIKEALGYLASRTGCVVIKRGRNGALGLLQGKEAAVPAFPVAAVDTTGAGDSFAAGFVHAYLEGRDLVECLEFGNACGALSARRIGGTAGQPTRAQLDQFLKLSRKGRRNKVDSR